MRIRYHPEAEAETIDAARYYDSKRAGLGRELLDEIDAAIESILSDPTRLPVVEDDVRRHVVKRFPYEIYFFLEEDVVEILVVKHHSRHPDYWRSRR